MTNCLLPNDTPTSGAWSPTNNTGSSNMTDVSDYTYDGGGVGDGNLTQQINHPGASQPDRKTLNYYDWRDRLMTVKNGVESTESTSTNRPIFYYTYDNLNELTQYQRYDGDTVSITSTSGVPNAPSSSLLRAQTGTRSDD